MTGGEMGAGSRLFWLIIGVSAFAGVLNGCQSGNKEDVLAVAGDRGEERERRVYQVPEGVQVHIPAIIGLKYSTFQGGPVEAPLGKVVEETVLPGIRGREIRYEKGVLYVARDTIYGVLYEFFRPVGRIDAIHLTGFPESLDGEFKGTSREQRIEHSAYGLRRLVLTRTAPGEDRYTQIQAWKFLPQEKF